MPINHIKRIKCWVDAPYHQEPHRRNGIIVKKTVISKAQITTAPYWCGVRCCHIHSSHYEEYEQRRYLLDNTDIYSRFTYVNTAYVYWLLTSTTWSSEQGLYIAGMCNTRFVVILVSYRRRRVASRPPSFHVLLWITGKLYIFIQRMWGGNVNVLNEKLLLELEIDLHSRTNRTFILSY